MPNGAGMYCVLGFLLGEVVEFGLGAVSEMGFPDSSSISREEIQSW